MTLMDRWDVFMNSLIRRSNRERPKDIPDDDIFKADDYGEESQKFNLSVDGKRLTPELRRRMALTAPFYMKGLKKKARDTFRAGWRYEKIKNKNEPTAFEKSLLEHFNRRNNIKILLTLLKMDAHIYGDGVALIKFLGEDKPDLSSPPKPNAEPYYLKRINPEFIDSYKYKNKSYEKKGVQHLYYVNKSNRKEKYIHPARLFHIKETDFAFSKLGISDIDILRNIISSMADIDIATGKILKWFSHGIVEWKKAGAKKQERKEMIKILKSHPDSFASNERYELKVHTAEAIDPKEFYNYVIMAIAAVLVMPTHVLKGVEVGKVTGAEAAYSDYYRDISDTQDLIYAPKLTEIYERIFKAHDRVFDYNIIFNKVYVNEMAEAELDGKRAATAVNLRNSDIIDLEEARKIYNHGHVRVDETKKIKERNKPVQKPTEPAERVVQPVKKEEADKSKKVAQQMMIDRRKDMIEDIGKREEYLQEVRLRKAQKEKIAEMKRKVESLKDDIDE